MHTFIVALQQEDGFFPTVGMNGRRQYRLKTFKGLWARLNHSSFAQDGDNLEVTRYHDSRDCEPYAAAVYRKQGDQFIFLY